MGTQDLVVNATPFPWQVEQWQRFVQLARQQKLPHAILLQGADGVGKDQLGRCFARHLLCEQREQALQADRVACGSCKSCGLLAAGYHPDLIILEPEQDAAVIKIDQVRTALQQVAQTAQQGGYRVVIITPADRLNVNAANALLKNLEEPAPNIQFLLISSRGSAIPATVRSRCNSWVLPLPERVNAKQWLAGQLSGQLSAQQGVEEGASAPSKELPGDSSAQQLSADELLDFAKGAPLRALALSANELPLQRQRVIKGLVAVLRDTAGPSEVAQQWQDIELFNLFEWLEYWVQDLIKLKLTANNAVVHNQDVRKALEKISQHISANELYYYVDKIAQCRKIVQSGHNPNRNLMLEELLICWLNCCKKQVVN